MPEAWREAIRSVDTQGIKRDGGARLGRAPTLDATQLDPRIEGMTAPKMRAHYIASTNRERPGTSGTDMIVIIVRSPSGDEFTSGPEADKVGTPRANKSSRLRRDQ